MPRSLFRRGAAQLIRLSPDRAPTATIKPALITTLRISHHIIETSLNTALHHVLFQPDLYSTLTGRPEVERQQKLHLYHSATSKQGLVKGCFWASRNTGWTQLAGHRIPDIA